MYQLKKVYLEITNVCNLRCDFCPGTRRPQGFLSPEDFSVLAQKLRPHTEYLYLHLMGEPLLHPQLPKLLDIAAGLGFQVNLTTNGTLLPQRASLLCQSPAVRKVSVSLHSFEGNEGLSGRLHRLCPAGRPGGQAVRPAAVEFRWRDHPGGQFLQRTDPPPPGGDLPPALEGGLAGHHPGPPGLSGVGGAVRVARPERRRPGTVRLLPGPAGPRRRAVGRHGGPLLPGPRGGHPPGEPV